MVRLNIVGAEKRMETVPGGLQIMEVVVARIERAE